LPKGAADAGAANKPSVKATAANESDLLNIQLSFPLGRLDRSRLTIGFLGRFLRQRLPIERARSSKG